MTDELTPAELAQITGKRRIAAQAVVLVKMGVPFNFLAHRITVRREALALFELLRPTQQQASGVDFSSVR